MTERRALIVGASRGLGLGLAQQLAARGWAVIATERSHSADLAAAAADAAIEVATADVTDNASLAALAAPLGDKSLDLVLVNAGVIGPPHQSVEGASEAEVGQLMMTNAVGPASAATKLLPKLKDGGVLAFMTSGMGSISTSAGGYALYRMSKAAQNMLARDLSEQGAKARGIAVLSLNPGWVQTDMGGPGATLTVEQSTGAMADLLEAPHPAEHRFVSYDGSEIAW